MRHALFWAVTAVTSSLVKAQPVDTPAASSSNLLKNPSFENYTSSGPYGHIVDWENTGRVYPVNYAPSAQDGTAYAIMRIDKPGTSVPTLFQTVKGLDTTRKYRLSFYYDFYEYDGMKSCTLVVSVGDTQIYSKKFTAADKTGNKWHLVKPAALKPKSPSQTIKFQYGCIPKDGAADFAVSYFFLDHTGFAAVGSAAEEDQTIEE